MLPRFDKNAHHADTKIGSCLVPMFPFQMNDGHTGENWFPLRTGKGKDTKLAGELHIASQWLENGMLDGARGRCFVVRDDYVSCQGPQNLFVRDYCC